jgi:hypothetical protein
MYFTASYKQELAVIFLFSLLSVSTSCFRNLHFDLNHTRTEGCAETIFDISPQRCQNLKIGSMQYKVAQTVPPKLL